MLQVHGGLVDDGGLSPWRQETAPSPSWQDYHTPRVDSVGRGPPEAPGPEVQSVHCERPTGRVLGRMHQGHNGKLGQGAKEHAICKG